MCIARRKKFGGLSNLAKSPRHTKLIELINCTSARNNKNIEVNCFKNLFHLHQNYMSPSHSVRAQAQEV